MDLLVDVKELQRDAEEFTENKTTKEPTQTVNDQSPVVPTSTQITSETPKEGKQEVESTREDLPDLPRLPENLLKVTEELSDLEDNNNVLFEDANQENLLDDISMRKVCNYCFLKFNRNWHTCKCKKK